MASLDPTPEEADGPWSTERFAFDNSFNLSYEPSDGETLLFRATCTDNYAGPYVPVFVSAEIGPLPNGIPTALTAIGSDFRQTYRGTTAINESGNNGVTLALRINDPLWEALEQSPDIRFNVPNEDALKLNTNNDMISGFVTECERMFSSN